MEVLCSEWGSSLFMPPLAPLGNWEEWPAFHNGRKKRRVCKKEEEGRKPEFHNVEQKRKWSKEEETRDQRESREEGKSLWPESKA